MPRAPKPCGHPGCTNLATHGNRCDEHHRAHNWTRYPSARNTILTDREREQFRRAVLRRDRTCKACHSRPATEADHIVPIAAGGTNDPTTNGQGLCSPCHAAKTRAERGHAKP